FLEDAQWWPADRLRANRDEALRALVKVAHREVPFYRSLLENAGLQPEDIRGAGDLCRLPAVTKQMLRAGYPAQTTRNTGQKAYEVSSSGSTGMNFRLWEDAETSSLHRAAFLLAVGWSGWRLGEPHLQTGMTTKRSFEKQLKDNFLRCYYV